MKTRSYLILMAAAILIPLIAFSLIGLNMLLQRERESRILAVQETARATALAIDEEIADAQGALRILANTPFVRTGDLSLLHDVMDRGSKTRDSWTVVFDYDGNTVAHTIAPLETRFPRSDHAWVAPIIDSQQPNVSDLRIGTISKVPVISVNYPVPASSGKKYLISQIFRAEHFNRLLRSRDMPVTWIVGLFDANGISVARNTKVNELVGKPVRPDLYQASLRSFSGQLRHVTRENIAVYSVFTHTNRTGWTVAIGVPEKEIEAPAGRAAWYAALAMGLVFAFAGTAILFLARRLTSSVDEAVIAAKALGNGHLPTLKKSRVAEVDVLQTALHDAGVALSKENSSRQMLERERETLLRSEQAARKQAEAQNKAKDEFLAMLGHELRNPLGTISSTFTILEMPNANAEHVRRARQIGRRQVDHLSRIVDDLLDVGRIMAGKIDLKKQPVELGVFVQRCIDSLRAVHHDSHDWTVQAADVWVNADPTRLEQIIGNVLSNAVRYTPDGGSISVTVLGESDEAVIRVKDTGIGITADLLPRIFDIFVQGPTTMDRASGGLGMGLPLVQRLLALHGGSVCVESAGTGAGSTFELRLPRQQESGSAVNRNVPATRAETAQHVLVVEDDDDGRDMLETLLTLHGFRVSTAANGREALRIAMQQRPGVAIIDVGLPDLTGYEVAENLQADPATRHILLIALTGYGLDQDRRRASAAGFAVHFTKPYTTMRLLEAIGAASSPRVPNLD